MCCLCCPKRSAESSRVRRSVIGWDDGVMRCLSCSLFTCVVCVVLSVPQRAAG